MKLAIINGSPRGRKSNSDRIIGWMTKCMDENFVKYYAADIKKQEASAKDAAQADSILIVFPLYTDMMPGLLKAFLEQLNEYDLEGKSIAFVVHSGFGEAIHSRTVEKYLKYFAKINGMKLLGTVVMGGSEALQVAPDNYFGKRVEAFHLLGMSIKEQKELDSQAVKKIARVEKYSKVVIMILKLLPTDMYWNKQLKKNSVYEMRNDRPYLE